jgi:hypothetical protein
VAAIADMPSFGPCYIGSALVPSLAVNQSHTVSIPMTTMGWEPITGTIKLIIDPYDSLPEKGEANNQLTTEFEVFDSSITSTPTPTMGTTPTPTWTR